MKSVYKKNCEKRRTAAAVMAELNGSTVRIAPGFQARGTQGRIMAEFEWVNAEVLYRLDPMGQLLSARAIGGER